MSPSKNNLTMINLIFLLGISLPQVSAAIFQPACTDLSNQCCDVVGIWKSLGGNTTVDPNWRNACCKKLGDTYQPNGIPGVICTADGKVTELRWGGKNLTGDFDHFFGNLVDLEKL